MQDPDDSQHQNQTRAAYPTPLQVFGNASPTGRKKQVKQSIFVIYLPLPNAYAKFSVSRLTNTQKDNVYATGKD